MPKDLGDASGPSLRVLCGGEDTGFTAAASTHWFSGTRTGQVGARVCCRTIIHSELKMQRKAGRSALELSHGERRNKVVHVLKHFPEGHENPVK